MLVGIDPRHVVKMKRDAPEMQYQTWLGVNVGRRTMTAGNSAAHVQRAIQTGQNIRARFPQSHLLPKRGSIYHTLDIIMASSTLPGVRSPASPRSGATSPRPKFDSDQLKPYIKKLLSSTLQDVTWADFKEKERKGALMKEIGDRVKERMLGTHVSLPPAGRAVHLNCIQRLSQEDCG